MYCIYSGSNINDLSSIQHIIPLSLGGVDDFIINISQEKNSYLGSKVEGPLINEFTMKLKQMHFNTIGQSGSKTVMKLKAQINEQPVSVKWSKEKIDVFDPIKKEHLNGTGAIKIKTQINLYTRIRFLAKIALETGYFLFDETFINHADCDTLRNVIFCNDFSNQNFDIRFYDNLHPINEADKVMHSLNKLLIECMDGSSIILGFAEDRIIISVGILGDYLGTINFSANVERFPIYDDYFRLGHVLLCRDNNLYRDSYFHTIYEFSKKLNIKIDENQIEW